VDDHSLSLLEFDRVTLAVSERAAGEGARACLRAWRPIADRTALAREHAMLAEAIRRQAEPGAWCHVGPGLLGERLAAGAARGCDGPALVEIRSWLEAAAATREAWSDAAAAARHPLLAEQVGGLPVLDALQSRLDRSLEPDGRVADGASPALKRARAELNSGERDLQRRLERWARGFGETAFVTRHGDRFVALVPAAGFPRRRGIVHDVSGSGQSLFVEPLEACEANNRLIECASRAAEEERRVLAELSGLVQASRPELARTDQILVHLDTLRARARWAQEFGAVAIAPGGGRLRLRGARHPLLAMAEPQRPTVPLDLDLGPEDRMLLVSGPNMGGKTVLLKTAGLAVALSHAAVPMPAAEGSAVPEIDEVLADLGDEQSVDQGLSTFAAHVRGLAVMAAHASPRSLLLCDELGAGTDPEEGAALGRALVEHFVARRAWGVVTTHLGSLKRVAGEVPGVVNGSLEFDVATMTPRYRFIAGVPGASHALAVAERLGFPREVLERARAITPEESRSLERLLEDLQQVSRRMREQSDALVAARAEAESAAAAHRAATEDSRRSLSELRRRLTGESEVLLSHARELWQSLQREARRSEKTRAGAAAVRTRIEEVEREARRLEDETAAAGGAETETGAPLPLEAVTAGRRVRVTDLGIEAEVVSGPDADGRVVLRRGNWSIQSHVARLAAVPGAGTPGGGRPPNGGAAVAWESSDEAPPVMVDLRGMEAEEALRALDQGLDRAVLAGLGELRVVHGIGRGVLRKAVEGHLRGHPQVAALRLGQVGEGGRGVTVVSLR